VVMERLDQSAVVSAGSFSSLVVARRHSDNRLYCVKVFQRDMIPVPDPNEVETPLAFRVLRELRGIQTVSQVVHPFIVQYCFAYKTARFFLFGMQRDGVTDFLTRIAAHGTFDVASTRVYAAELCLALAHIHSFDLVHRDVKPENVVICVDGHIKLADFGSSLKLTGRVGDEPPPPRFASLAGTPEYMPPEVVLRVPICESVDWWAFGCFICEMLIGRTPFFQDDGVGEIFARITGNQSIATLIEHPLLPDTASSLLQALLIRNPANRLGARPHGYQAVLGHEWFSGVNAHAALRKELEPPWRPFPPSGPAQPPLQQGDFEVDLHAGGQTLADTYEWPAWPHTTEQSLLDSADWGDAVAFAEFD